MHFITLYSNKNFLLFIGVLDNAFWGQKNKFSKKKKQYLKHYF